LRTLAGVRRTALLPLVLIAAAAAAPLAAQRTLSLREVDAAVLLGQTRIAADRARFHAPYRISVNQPPVDYVDVVTPYRRVVLAADEQAQFGNRSFGQRQALELLKTADGQFDFVIELTFHPLNTFVTMPAYDVALVRSGSRSAPATLDRQPRFGARVEGLPPAIPVPGGRIPTRGSQPMLGGTVIARFAGDGVDSTGAQVLVVSDQGKDVARITIDLGRLR
jgi:hypothetical protein